MDRYEIIEDVRAKLGSTTLSDDALNAYVDTAQEAMVNHVWPYDDAKTWDDVSERCHHATCDIAVYLASRQGSEGETYHSENGTVRQYAETGIPSAYFSGIPSHVGVPR